MPDHRWSVLCVALAAAACTSEGGGNGGTGPPPPPPPPGPSLVADGGTAQKAPAGTTLPAAYRVRARESNGAPVAGVTVYWSVLSGGGAVSADSSVTDAAGLASTTHTLSAGIGVQQVLARAPALAANDTSLRNVVFSGNALAGGPPWVVASVPVPPNYGIHDTFVRDGLAFVCNWDTGLQIYDVGHGIKGGSPSNPVLVSTIVTAGGSVHNAWWFHNPVTGEKRYVFVGEEGPGSVGTSSSGDIHVVDVSNLAAPVEVASYHMPSLPGDPTFGTHNFWMDEPNQVLYAAFYNGGMVALDVSGTLSGPLSGRVLASTAPGAQPYFWGVQLFNGFVYGSDMTGGLWQLSRNGGTFSVAGGGNNVPERWTSDLWVHGSYAYTGTWGFPRVQGGPPGNALKVWALDAGGSPSLVDSVITASISTVSDVEVSADGRLLMFSTEGGGNNGIHFYSLADPAKPAFVAKHLVAQGVHTATLGYIAGRVYAFGAVDPGNPALLVLDVTGVVP